MVNDSSLASIFEQTSGSGFKFTRNSRWESGNPGPWSSSDFLDQYRKDYRPYSISTFVKLKNISTKNTKFRNVKIPTYDCPFSSWYSFCFVERSEPHNSHLRYCTCPPCPGRCRPYLPSTLLSLIPDESKIFPNRFQFLFSNFIFRFLK